MREKQGDKEKDRQKGERREEPGSLQPKGKEEGKAWKGLNRGPDLEQG